MSGSGGYYKYRCKYWLTYNCPHWVWVNNAPCAHCLADGRDSEMAEMSAPFRLSREVFVPQFEDGMLLYTVMEIVAGSDWDSGWAVKETPAEPAFPSVTGPTAVTISAMDGVDTQETGKIGVQSPAAGRN
ncbi:hypothetical protein ONS95_011491 [Cadophora gregata]|uniref:uncharacterized protein n=1 Tax=Cadophora gregata TaxID=51156 RepID=UPI0026DC0C50|nr:uncharacterized protein ONS95_011491 [Cadophora gregata]KAK0120078.1 hypothetical protein ONS95_011491 [Cadophora gregata]KAK0121109.1 hypothetical protein ONS96_011291 [Cadophora gregata f. sp. sojae]